MSNSEGRKKRRRRTWKSLLWVLWTVRTIVLPHVQRRTCCVTSCEWWISILFVKDHIKTQFNPSIRAWARSQREVARRMLVGDRPAVARRSQKPHLPSIVRNVVDFRTVKNYDIWKSLHVRSSSIFEVRSRGGVVLDQFQAWWRWCYSTRIVIYLGCFLPGSNSALWCCVLDYFEVKRILNKLRFQCSVDSTHVVSLSARGNPGKLSAIDSVCMKTTNSRVIRQRVARSHLRPSHEHGIPGRAQTLAKLIIWVQSQKCMLSTPYSINCDMNATCRRSGGSTIHSAGG